jgi:uncharacterized protein HemX
MLGINTYLAIALAVVMGIMGAYFFYSQYEIKNLNNLVQAQKTDILAQDDYINQLQKDAKDIQVANQTLSQVIESQNSQTQVLENKLNALKGTPAQKMAALEKIINLASTQRMRCIAIATGAVPVKNETNKVCPQLMPKKVSSVKKVVKNK